MNFQSENYNFAFPDEGSKREIRRAILKAVAIPGYQVPFGSRELPIGRGWGIGGIQITLALIGPNGLLKVIDQGSDESVNAVNIKKFVTACTGVSVTTDSEQATLIQTRHRIPEVPLRNDQILVLQVPLPEPLRLVEPREGRHAPDARRERIQPRVAAPLRGPDKVQRDHAFGGLPGVRGQPLYDAALPYPPLG
jgi:alpha-D-ribose 1-methylphosphonate 5-phosphate C-P lyase